MNQTLHKKLNIGMVGTRRQEKNIKEYFVIIHVSYEKFMFVYVHYLLSEGQCTSCIYFYQYSTDHIII